MPVTPSLTYEFVNAALLKLEQTLHREGWDQPSRIFTVHTRHNNTMGLTQIPVQIQNPVGEFIEFMGDRMTDGSEFSRDIIESTVCAIPGFLGLLLVTEAWSNESISPTEHQVLLQKGLSLQDLPDTKEVRVIQMVDTFGRVYAVFRLRGEKPRSEPNYGGGRIHTAMVKMVRAFASALPEGQADLDALLAVVTPTQEEMQEAYQEFLRRQGSSGTPS
jgi:hypothetical protein